MGVRAASSVVGTVYVGTVQGAVTHAVHRLRPVPPAVRDRRLADHCQHADRSHVLRAVRRTVHHAHTDVRHFKAHVR